MHHHRPHAVAGARSNLQAAPPNDAVHPPARDGIERIVEMIQAGPQKFQFSHRLLHVITTLLTSTYAAGSRVMVLTTTSASREIRETVLGIDSLFQTQIELELLRVEAAQTVLQARRVQRLGGGTMSLPPRLEVTVRDILSIADAARFEVEKAAAGGGGDVNGAGAGDKGKKAGVPLAPVLLSQPHFDELLELVVPTPSNVSWHGYGKEYGSDGGAGVKGRFEQS